MLTPAFTENTAPTKPLTAETLLDLVAEIWAKSEPVTTIDMHIHPDIWRLKLEPWRRKNRALEALGLKWNSPKARRIKVKPRPYLTT